MKKINSVATIALCFSAMFTSNLVFAHSYFPPERIQCQKENDNIVRCHGFDNRFLTIGAITDAKAVQENTVLTFLKGESASRIGPIRFTYQNGDESMIVFLVNSNPNVKPDFRNPSHWFANGQAFTCHSYMTCPITDKE